MFPTVKSALFLLFIKTIGIFFIFFSIPFNCVKKISKGVAISILRDARLTDLDCSYSAGFRATLVFVAVCKNIKHYSVAKPHAGVPSSLSLLSQTAIRFCKIFKS